MDDSSAPVTKGDLAGLATKADIVSLAATIKDIAALSLATKADLAQLKIELSAHFKQINEQFKLAREDSDRILDVVIAIEKKHTKRMDGHEKRIVVLEGAIAA